MIHPHGKQVRGVAVHYDTLDQFYREIWGEHVHHGYWRTGHEIPRMPPLRWSSWSPPGSISRQAT